MNLILLGRAESRPDPRVGDVCRLLRDGKDLGLWVPFAGCGGRSDGETVHYYGWMFARFDNPEHHRRFSLSEVERIEIPCEDQRAIEFWSRLKLYVEG